MDWSNIITFAGIIAGIVGGWELKTLINPKAAKKHPELENKDLAVDTLNKVIETLSQTVTQTKESEAYYKQLYEEEVKKREQDQLVKEQLMKETVTKSFLLCVHSGCELRKPTRGQGDTWYEEYKDDPSLGCDFLPINRLLAMYYKPEDSSEENVTE